MTGILGNIPKCAMGGERTAVLFAVDRGQVHKQMLHPKGEDPLHEGRCEIRRVGVGPVALGFGWIVGQGPDHQSIYRVLAHQVLELVHIDDFVSIGHLVRKHRQNLAREKCGSRTEDVIDALDVFGDVAQTFCVGPMAVRVEGNGSKVHRTSLCNRTHKAISANGLHGGRFDIPRSGVFLAIPTQWNAQVDAIDQFRQPC